MRLPQRSRRRQRTSACDCKWYLRPSMSLYCLMLSTARYDLTARFAVIDCRHFVYATPSLQRTAAVPR
jgi:hypothetical protein